MNSLSISYIQSICAKFEGKVKYCLKLGLNNNAIRFLKVLSYIRYKFYLGYKNDFIEDCIKELSNSINNKKFKENGIEKSIAIIDNVNSDYIGLMPQYLEALISGSYHFLYLYEHKEHSTATRNYLMQTLCAYDRAILKEIPSCKPISKSQWIYNEICSFGTTKIITHLGEWAIEECVACAALPSQCEQFRINCADHCFWAGASCVDYTLEFRHYGANITLNKRGIDKNHIIYVPFYPLMQVVSFKGFPKECIGKFIFLSGGAIYKIVDEEKTFFKLCKSILDKCPEAILIFAGADLNNSVLSDGIEEYGLQGRFFPVGYRTDIFEVFKHCDVFINTYPVGGGLMCQYAAQCSKPILNYKDKGDEECVAQKTDCNFTFFSEEEFIQEAVKLYSDKEYRIAKGKLFNNAVISKNEFNEAVLSFLQLRKKHFDVKWDDAFIQYEYNTEDAIEYCNKKLAAFYYKLFQLLKSDFIFSMPLEFFSLCVYSVKRLLNKMLNIITNNQ